MVPAATRSAQVGNAIIQSALRTGAQVGSRMIESSFKNAPKKILGGLAKAGGLTVSLVLMDNLDATGPHREFSDRYYEKGVEEYKELIKYRSVIEKTSNTPKQFFITYTKTKTNRNGNTITYSGRTSGTYLGNLPTHEDAEVAVSIREAGHVILKREGGYAPAVVEEFSIN